MRKFFQLGLVGVFLNFWGLSPQLPAPIPTLAWQNAEVFDLPTGADPQVEAIVTQYLKRLAAKGLPLATQRVWIQSDWAELANYQGMIPSSAASLTKVATTLAAVQTWGLGHRFQTSIYYSGKISGGILTGDLIVQGGGDPLFVWEEAIAVANALHSAGIEKVRGNLIITGDFTMNFQEEPQKSGELLKTALDSRLWTAIAQQQFASLPPSTPKPQLEILGTVQVKASLPPSPQLLLRHQSLTLSELLKQMNLYSNNFIAESLARSLGGSDRVVAVVREKTQIDPSQIQLINGSGLGVDNRIAAEAVAEIFMTLERELKSQGVSITDLFPVSGRDKTGTLQGRGLPLGVAVKTGTLAQVSALAGMIPTQERGSVWFTIINSGGDIEALRREQDRLLQDLSKHWRLTPQPGFLGSVGPVFLGDPARNIKSSSPGLFLDRK